MAIAHYQIDPDQPDFLWNGTPRWQCRECPYDCGDPRDMAEHIVKSHQQGGGIAPGVTLFDFGGNRVPTTE